MQIVAVFPGCGCYTEPNEKKILPNLGEAQSLQKLSSHSYALSQSKGLFGFNITIQVCLMQ